MESIFVSVAVIVVIGVVIGVVAKTFLKNKSKEIEGIGERTELGAEELIAKAKADLAASEGAEGETKKDEK